MIFVVLAKDRPGALDLRLANIDAHRAYLAEHQHPVETLLSGPLLAEGDESMVGSFFMVEAESRAAVEAWQADDPLKAIDLWESVTIEVFLKRVDNLSPAS
ncbi:MAG: YciI family protein [Pseudomonadota bacterium]